MTAQETSVGLPLNTVDSHHSPHSRNSQADEARSVKSAARVLDVLELMASTPNGFTFSHLALRLGLPKSSLFALLTTLVDRRWLALDESRRYRTGIRAWEAGQGYHQAASLARSALKHLRDAREELDETVQLAVLDGIEALYIAKVETDKNFKVVSQVGVRLPAYATGLGKVLLAELPLDELRRRMAGTELERFTEHTAQDIAELEKRLERIRRQGWGTDEGEYTIGVRCVAVPVHDESGAVVAAMSCSLPAARIDAQPSGITTILQALRRHAGALSATLGWRAET